MTKKVEQIAKKNCVELARLLKLYGIRRVVVSPGSRNAPVIVAIHRILNIEPYFVIDERSASFIALGMAHESGEPVALVCTSGSAPLNYAPAISEAYYRGVPLIVITADRPYEWIDQDDSQTIRQPGIYSNFIKGTFDIPEDNGNPDTEWYINRKINDALTLAVQGKPGPVHINIRLSEPLTLMADVDEDEVVQPRVIDVPRRAETRVPDEIVRELAKEFDGDRKVMVVVGYMSSNVDMKGLEMIARLPNVVVLHEAQSNLHGSDCPDYIGNIDSTLVQASGCDNPDTVITLGGSLTSRMIKERLRKTAGLRHIHIGMTDAAVDCFGHLQLRLPYPEEIVINSLAASLECVTGGDTPFKAQWRKAHESACKAVKEYAARIAWCDFKAMSIVLSMLPGGVNLQLSNGTAVRYAQLFDYSRLGGIECNRGVSGIDGCTSTAIGAAVASSRPTVLISGDMSFQYDLGALACNFIPSDMMMIVLDNQGGGIFRFIKSTRGLAELDRYFAGGVNLPLENLAEGFGFEYRRADCETALRDALSRPCTRACIVHIVTDGKYSAETLTQFFKNK